MQFKVISTLRWKKPQLRYLCTYVPMYLCTYVPIISARVHYTMKVQRLTAKRVILELLRIYLKTIIQYYCATFVECLSKPLQHWRDHAASFFDRDLFYCPGQIR